MPQFLYDWQLWWIDFWMAHPVIFWSVVIISGVATILLRRR